jgi:Na+-transporting NADH:ubiquinone oxidoreductase subunit NqrC
MKRKALICLLAVIALVFATGVVIAADAVTIQGQVNEENQLVDQDGNVYKIADTEEGMKVMDMVGEKVEVKGTVQEDMGEKEITVDSFSVVK